MPFFKIASLTEIVPTKEISGFSKDEKVLRCSDCIEDTKRSKANRAAYGVINYESAEHLQEREESGGVEYVCAEQRGGSPDGRAGIEQVLALEPGTQVISGSVLRTITSRIPRAGAGTLVCRGCSLRDETSPDFAGKWDVMAWSRTRRRPEGHYESEEATNAAIPKKRCERPGTPTDRRKGASLSSLRPCRSQGRNLGLGLIVPSVRGKGAS